ncbi:MAG: PA2169 family four-helix-bundle protein, partial [Mucilaginibacter polytrichastri]|nr:PA2169 family four-helix-bundle protein [Mucilaginibacter polytrichastri]
MSTNEKTIEVLNDLAQINNDRIAGFQDALKNLDAEDVDLKAIFSEYSDQSRKFSQELSAAVGALGGDPETSKSASGALHRAWIDVKAVFTDHGRKSILEEAERGEDAIKKAYREALSNTEVVL